MFIIAGLGNPGSRYEGTRHNVGFNVIDAIAHEYNIAMEEKKFRAYIGQGEIEGEKVILVKPQTYMNLSGDSLRGLVNYFKINPKEELFVAYDDVSLNTGQIRIRAKGSAGGHNGVRNIIENLGTEEFIRVKMGVGIKPEEANLVDYVLGRFTRKERERIEEACVRVTGAIAMLVKGEMLAAMNKYNRKVKNAEE